MLETSGAAVAEPLADALLSCGFSLELVVAVVDADAGPGALQQELAQAQVRRLLAGRRAACAAQAGAARGGELGAAALLPALEPRPPACVQVRAADLVVVNKCDLASLGGAAAVEDAVQALAPGVRMVRARFGQVRGGPAALAAGRRAGGWRACLAAPAPGRTVRGGGCAPAAAPQVDVQAVLDVEAPEDGGEESAPGAAAAAAAAAGSVAFLSHEPVPAANARRGSRGAGVAAQAGGGSKQSSGGGGRSKLAAAWAKERALQALQQAEGSSGGGSGGSTAPGAGHQHHGHEHHSTGQAQGQAHRHHGHSSFHTVSVLQEAPVSMEAFQRYVAQQLLPCAGLTRAKGILWMAERRSHRCGGRWAPWRVLAARWRCTAGGRSAQQLCAKAPLPLTRRFVFHLSGRQRVQCCSEGPWEAPPGCQLVLIGQDPQLLQRLAGAFRELCQAQAPAAAAAAAAEAAAAAAAAAEGSVAGAEALHAELARLVGQHERLEVLGSAAGAAAADGPAAAGKAGSSGAQGPVEFSAIGSPLHGVIAEEVNAQVRSRGGPGLLSPLPPLLEAQSGLGHRALAAGRARSPSPTRWPPRPAQVMRRVNAGGQVLLYGRTAPPLISSVSGLQSADRMSSLMLCPLGGDAAEVAQQWEGVQQAMAPVLRKAFQHVHNCKCDVAAAFTAAQ